MTDENHSRNRHSSGTVAQQRFNQVVAAGGTPARLVSGRCTACTLRIDNLQDMSHPTRFFLFGVFRVGGL